jgi:1-deoxy-D-xylulose-5-phosphate reductoisomerase
MKTYCILGSTGSIGTQALEVIAANSDIFEIRSAPATGCLYLLIEQAARFK